MALVIKKPIAKNLSVAKSSAGAKPNATIRFVTKSPAAKPAVTTRPLVVPKAVPVKGTVPAESRGTVPVAPEEASVSALAIKRAEKAENLKNYLFKSVASDVRRPLEDIASTLQALREGAGSEEERAAAIDWLATASLSLVQLLDELIDISEADRADAAEKTRVSIESIVGDVVEAYRSEANAKGLSISASFEGTLPELEFDGQRLGHILRRLVDSAVKFTTSGRIGIGAAYSGEKLTLYVEDTGCGMPVDAQRKFAETTNFGEDAGGFVGTELAIIRRLVMSLGGEIALVSTPGIGTVMTLVFKGVKSLSAPEGRDLGSMQKISFADLGPLDDAPAKHHRVLVADPSPVHRAVIAEMLRSLGCESVATVSNGQEALVKVVTGACDVVFTDLALDGMTGRDLVREIRKIATFAKLPVHALTADESILPEADSLGFTSVVLKPATSDKLRRSLAAGNC